MENQIPTMIQVNRREVLGIIRSRRLPFSCAADRLHHRTYHLVYGSAIVYLHARTDLGSQINQPVRAFRLL
ncbi:hypothetical protein [Heyndrickxia oleronia]|uniref:hypothetical protein n=1 Tax=Heyndrickxia oleronia TaxID=38875 RepID=UPI0021B4C6D5|nr:hypothetical protein [Heyndrickxia oleronia]